MHEKEVDLFSIAGLRNEKMNLSDGGCTFMDDRTKLHLRDLECRHSLHERMKPTKEERDIQARLHSTLLEKLGARDDYEHLRQLARERMNANRLLSGLSLLDGPGSMIHPFSDPTDDGIVVWWARTQWF